MKKKKHRIADKAIWDAAHEAIRQAGWTIPTDEEAVAAAEARMTGDMPKLPAALRNPQLPSAAGNDTSAGKVVPLWDSAVLAAPMARAARQGGSVSAEVEEAMKRDREIAEQELRDRNKDRENDDG